MKNGNRLFNVLLVLLIVVEGGNFVQHSRSALDRAELRRELLMQKRMLDKRAENQIMLYEALRRAGLLTPAETDRFEANRQAAWYPPAPTR